MRVVTSTGGNTLYYVHSDHLGSTSLMTCGSGCGTAGALIAGSRQSYYPFGAVRTAASSLPTDITFTGQHKDASTGLMFYNARYYSPVVGRFVSADTVVPGVSNPQAWNRYAYTVNNPVKYTDPSGHSLCSDGMSACSASGLFYLPLPPSPSSAPSLSTQLAVLTGVPVVLMLAQAAASNAATMAQAAASDAAQDANDAADVEESDATELGELPDDALVCRGGLCTRDRFAGGTGVTVEEDGTLSGVSVNSGTGKSLEELTSTIPNRQVGVTTVGEVRAEGGDVTPDPTKSNPYHCQMCGITAEQAEKLFTPTLRNPHLD